jgi:hypothetical protein
MNELYTALGRFVVRFSLVGATMVRAMVPPDEQRSKERALKFIEMDFSKLVGQWHKMMTEDARTTVTDRRTVGVIKDEATRLMGFRNRLMHDWWAEHLGAKGGLMLYGQCRRRAWARRDARTGGGARRRASRRAGTRRWLRREGDAPVR